MAAMKATFFLAATSLAATCFISQAVRGQSLENNSKPSVVVTGLDSDGLEVVSPESSSFDTIAKALLANAAADPVLSLKPCLVILSNHTERTVVAYAFIWKITYRDGPTRNVTTQFKYPDAIAGIPDTGVVPDAKNDALPLIGGKRTLVSEEIELGDGKSFEEPYYRDWLQSYAQKQSRDLAQAEKIEITLDVAIFSDGMLIGPDHSNLERDFMAFFEAKQKFFREVVTNLDLGKTMEEAFAPVNTAARQSPGFRQRDLMAFWERVAAPEILGLRKRIGDAAVPTIFRQAIRKESFVIRRDSGQ